MTEHVYMVWDIYDGVRSGIANFQGEPHYFESRYDETKDDGHRETFDLKKINADTLSMALEQWQIYRNWEEKFHSGQVPLSTHPGHGGIDERYDELELLLKQRIADAVPSGQAHALFRPKEHQPTRPGACLEDMEVTWSSLADN